MKTERCPNYVLDEDGEKVCECGDEGRMCSSCFSEAVNYWKPLYDMDKLYRDPESYEEAMRDAGRGHLLK